jgi:protein TonB
MQRVKWAFVLFALTTTGVWAQQAAAPAQPGPTIEKAPLIVPFNPVNTSDKTPLQACPAKFDYRPDEAIYRVGGGITPPRVTQYAIPELTKEARKAYKNNLFKDPNEVESRIAIVVDAQGKPQDLCLQKPAGFGLDEQAANAVRQYRFQPVTKNGGVPVAVRITIEVRFQTH